MRKTRQVVNGHVITWSEKQRRYIIKNPEKKQIYDCDYSHEAVGWVLRNTVATPIKKKIKYPSQEDAQVIIDIINRPNIYCSAANGLFKKLGEAVNTMPKNWEQLTTKAFGPKSPWSYTIDFKRNNLRVLYWDKEKAAKLGIN